MNLEKIIYLLLNKIHPDGYLFQNIDKCRMLALSELL